MAEANEGAFALAVWLGVRAATTGKTHSHPSCLRIPGTIQDNNRSSSWLNSAPVPDPWLDWYWATTPAASSGVVDVTARGPLG